MSQVLSRHGLGGSEVAAALGISPWQSPLALWLRKRAEIDGLPDPIPVIENEPIRWGRYLEQPIRQAYSDRFGVEIVTPACSMFHPEHSWRRATPDGLVLGEGHGEWGVTDRRRAPIVATDGRPVRGVEIKTASHHVAHLWGPDGTDEVPPHYATQCIWSMAVLDVDAWDLAVLIGGSDFRCYRLERDRDLEDEIVSQLDSFWHHNVLGNVMPEVDGSEAIKQYLVARWPGDGAKIQADRDLESLIAEILRLRSSRDQFQERLDAAENLLRTVIGNATEVESRYGRVLCRPRQGKRMTDWEAIARELLAASGATPADVESAIAHHTTRARPSRPLLLPRAASAIESEAP